MRSTNNNPAIKKINSYVFTRKFMILQKFVEINIKDGNIGLFSCRIYGELMYYPNSSYYYPDSSYYYPDSSYYYPDSSYYYPDSSYYSLY